MWIIESITFAWIIWFLTLFFGILVKVIWFPDQIIKNFKKKSTEWLSTKFMVLSFIVYVLWTIHWLLQNDIVLVLWQGLWIVTTWTILYQIVLYKKK